MEMKKRGKWKAGESGNPNGRPPVVGEVTKLRDSIAAHLPEIIMHLVTKAKEGDSQAARLLLERVLPPMKAIEQPVVLPLPDGEGMTAQGVAIDQAVAAGILAPDRGAALLTGLGALARIKEIDELERRITQLEGVKHEQRLKALEQQQSDAPMRVLFVGDRSTPEQQGEIDRTIKTGRMMIVFVARGDTAWIAGAGVPPWEQDGSDYHGDH